MIERAVWGIRSKDGYLANRCGEWVDVPSKAGRFTHAVAGPLVQVAAAGGRECRIVSLAVANERAAE